MNEDCRRTFLNPVLAIPWKTQMENLNNPEISLFPIRLPRMPKRLSESEKRRLENVKALVERFPGLKKCHAKAALMLAQNNLEKAIILLEVSQCYHQEIEQLNRTPDITYLKNIHISLHYNTEEEQYPVLRNIVYENHLGSTGSNKVQKNDRNARIRKSRKIGVFITKTRSGYKATPFDEVY